MREWISVKHELPEQGKVVDTCIMDEHGLRNKGKLKRRNGLWLIPDESMYVYHQPTHWRNVDG